MRRFVAFIGLTAVLLISGQVFASEVLSENARLPFTEHTLKNGMRLLIVERRESPTFAAYIRFKVGSVNEFPGQTGLAHLLEHMMFKGTTLFGSTDPAREQPLLHRIDALQRELQTERRQARLPGKTPDAGRVAAIEKELAALESEAKGFIVRNELWEIYRRNGGTNLNASTSRDGTQYFISLPKNRLELWALLESDRMRNPVFREFYTERDVVQEERRQRVDTNPRGQLMEAALATAFTAVPYRHPVLGWPGDLENLSRPQAQAYFKTHYAPNNTLAVLVGDLDPAAVIRVVEQYFGDLPAQPLPVPPLLEEPPQTGERRVQVEFPAEPSLLMLYQAPALGHPDTLPHRGAGQSPRGGPFFPPVQTLGRGTAPRDERLGRPLVSPARRAVPDPGYSARAAYRGRGGGRHRRGDRPPGRRARHPAGNPQDPEPGRGGGRGTPGLQRGIGVAARERLGLDWRLAHPVLGPGEAPGRDGGRGPRRHTPLSAASTSNRGHAGPRERARAHPGQCAPTAGHASAVGRAVMSTRDRRDG